jgi:hypothetical protein
VLPVLRGLCQAVDTAPQVQLCMAQLFGMLLGKVVDDVDNDQEVGVLLGCYRWG